MYQRVCEGGQEKEDTCVVVALHIFPLSLAKEKERNGVLFFVMMMLCIVDSVLVFVVVVGANESIVYYVDIMEVGGRDRERKRARRKKGSTWQSC